MKPRMSLISSHQQRRNISRHHEKDEGSMTRYFESPPVQFLFSFLQHAVVSYLSLDNAYLLLWV